MTTTIVLTCSRMDYLEKVITAIELLECDPSETNLLCIVDGEDSLYLRARNLVTATKFNQRLTVRLSYPGLPSRLDVPERRRRISAAHNQARSLISHEDGYVFSVEDDTLFRGDALQKLKQVALTNRAFAFAEGVELGRWGVPYIGAWQCDDIYNPTQITSIPNLFPVPQGKKFTQIDAGGLYCALIRTDIYKQHEFTSENGLGPDINFGIENRQLGFENFIVWDVPCRHLFKKNNVEKWISPADESRIVTLKKESETKWSVSY